MATDEDTIGRDVRAIDAALGLRNAETTAALARLEAAARLADRTLGLARPGDVLVLRMGLDTSPSDLEALRRMGSVLSRDMGIRVVLAPAPCGHIHRFPHRVVRDAHLHIRQ